ncbi:hypothetical protein Tco_0661230 [Tanacetum coccineum]
MSAKDTIAVQRCGLSAKELNEFLFSYPIPLEYDVILPTSTQTIFDAPLGYVGLYTHSFLFPISDSIISSMYPQLLLDENKLDSKSFKDKLPPNIGANPYFQRLGRYPISVCVFDDPILFLAGLQPSWEFGQQRPAIIVGGKEMAFRNFIYTEDDDDLAFLPKEPSPGFGNSSPYASVNTHCHIKERKCKMRGGSSRLPVKRKQASESSSSRAICAKTSASKDDAPILSISNDDKDANACHLKISAITPPAWKGHLDNQMDLELLHLHDRCYARQAMVDNAINKRACEFLQVIKKMSSEADEFDQNPTVLALREKISSLIVDVKEHKGNLDRMMLESQKWAGYQVTLLNLESKVGSLEAEKARLEAIKASLRREIEELKQDMRDVVSKVVPYAAMELVLASNDFSTATFPWLDEFIADATAPIEALLSKKPPTLQKPAPSRTQMPMPSS